MDIVHQHCPNENPSPPPLGDLSSRRLCRILLLAMACQDDAPDLRTRGATVDDARNELQRRELAGIARAPR